MLTLYMILHPMWKTDNKQNKYVKYILCQITTTPGGVVLSR